MEWIWYIIAALGAGIGTGLAGLSAATVMVPILIVLCPSFAGETGAYQATAIALASDILGSAVTAYTYARHKNIDLKRGWIMLVCILGMCTVGSYAAFRVGNVVLGSFTLFLTFFIGIRFLIRPDTSRKDTAARGEKLDWKGVAISLFFGLTIGFGTGFVGTGGGMMMLVVFTAFLGMELKTAVGTSTFIMTFTALIASVSHILIHPAILLEKWDVMLLCIVIATAASLLSARFANRVSNRTVGLVTGAVLTLLGGSMLLLYFWPQISAIPLAVQTLRCLGRLILYIIPCVLALLLIRSVTKIPAYVFRKLMHVVAFTCFTVMMLTAESWQAAALTSVIIAALIYPLLVLVENEKWYGRFFVQKSPGGDQAESPDAVLHVCGGHRRRLRGLRQTAHRSRRHPDVGNGRRIGCAGRHPVWQAQDQNQVCLQVMGGHAGHVRGRLPFRDDCSAFFRRPRDRTRSPRGFSGCSRRRRDRAVLPKRMGYGDRSRGDFDRAAARNGLISGFTTEGKQCSGKC